MSKKIPGPRFSRCGQEIEKVDKKWRQRGLKKWGQSCGAAVERGDPERSITFQTLGHKTLSAAKNT